MATELGLPEFRNRMNAASRVNRLAVTSPAMTKERENEMKRIALALLIVALVAPTALAQEPMSLHGKSLNMIISSAAGGGTDAYGRVALPYFEKYLPGSPSIVARNIPGADGMQGMNYMVQQVAPDGLTFIVNANTTADPLNYRK